MALDHYVTLGDSGLRVSPLCLGTMTFGEEWGWGCTPEESRRIMDMYMDHGGNFFDTANIYTKGHSEKIVGEHLGASSARRDRAVIATKFMGSMRRGDPNSGGAGRKAIVSQLEQSLRRMKTDHVDLYWMHCQDRFTPMQETLRALDDLVRDGKVRYIGVSNAPAWQVARSQTLAELKGWTPFVGLQVEYSLLARDVEGALIPMAAEMGLGVTPWSPLKGGLLSGKFTRDNAKLSDRGDWTNAGLTDHAYDVIDMLIESAAKVESTPAQVALSWVCGRPGVASTIIGARSGEQLADNIAAASLTLPGDVTKALTKATKPKLPYPHGFLKGMTAFYGNGAHIDGVSTTVFPPSPEREDDQH